MVKIDMKCLFLWNYLHQTKTDNPTKTITYIL